VVGISEKRRVQDIRYQHF